MDDTNNDTCKLDGLNNNPIDNSVIKYRNITNYSNDNCFQINNDHMCILFVLFMSCFVISLIIMMIIIILS